MGGSVSTEHKERAGAQGDAAKTVVTFEHISFAYDSALVVEDVNLEIPERSFACMVGPNGGGKTTLLKLMLGALQPDKGKVHVLGTTPERARHKIGYMPQYTLHDPQFPVTVTDVVLMGRLDMHWGGRFSKADKEAAHEALEEAEVADLARRKFSALSGGQRQRVLIARAIVSNPDLLLLDEPIANLDPSVGTVLLHVLEKLNERMTIIMVSHDLGFVSSVVTTVICVNRRVFVHPTSELSGDLVQDIYGSADLRMVQHNTRLRVNGAPHD